MQSESPSQSLIQKNNRDLSVRRQCELLGISHSSVYTKHADPDEEKAQLREKIWNGWITGTRRYRLPEAGSWW